MTTLKVKTVNLDEDRPFADMPMDVLLALLMAIQSEAIQRLDGVTPEERRKN